MSSLKKLFSSQSSSQQKLTEESNEPNEPKVYYSTQISTKTEVPRKEDEDLTESQFEQYDETMQSMQDSCYSWSGVSQSFDIKGEKREWSDEGDKEPWWESFKSQSSKKSTHLNHNQVKNQLRKRHFSHHNQVGHNKRRLTILNKKMMTINNITNLKKISCYLKLGKYKKFKYM